MIYRVPLTQGKFTIVDKDDVLFLCRWNWYYKGKYAVRKENGKTIYMHRVILERMGYKDFAEGDHIDINELNNLGGNLRPATRAQNGRNRNKQVNNTSGYTGVRWHTKNRRWIASIHVDGKIIYLGSFDCKIIAARMYDIYAQKHFGEFAVLNFPEDDK